jgi:hypothetical protein
MRIDVVATTVVVVIDPELDIYLILVCLSTAQVERIIKAAGGDATERGIGEGMDLLSIGPPEPKPLRLYGQRPCAPPDFRW